jgi:cyclomaltodextrinase
MTVPSWMKDEVFYQIFPDRFDNGDPNNDPINVHPWSSPPDSVHFQGGDLRGIINHLDYLQDLGIQALYLNPIFLSTSNHRYNTVDYFKIDPRLGTMADFSDLVRQLHNRSMHLVLDGVFNHCGRGFYAFTDVLENGRESDYIDWFHIHRFPLDAYSPDQTHNYQAWWGIKSLPKFNTDNQKVRNYIYGVARYWIEMGSDGWRLDVPNEIDDDDFWGNFRDSVKSLNSEAALIGEIWDVQPRWVGDRHFDGLMNYPFRTAILDLLQAGKSGLHTAEAIQKVVTAYPWENLLCMYNLVGSHDTERILTMLGGRIDLLRLAYLTLFALPGAPAIYYGDEIGLEGGKDPDCRRAFIWDEKSWNLDIRNWIKGLIQARKNHPALRTGQFEIVYGSSTDPVLVIKRSLNEENIIFTVNATSKTQEISISPNISNKPAEGEIQDLIGQKISAFWQDENLRVSLPPYRGAYFQI